MPSKVSQVAHARVDLAASFEIPQDLLDILQGMEDRMDLTPVMVDVSRIFEAPAIERFQSGGGGLWKSHAAATEKRWGSHPLLDLEPVGSGLVDTIDRTYGPDFAAAFSTAPHAHFAQYGTEQDGKEHNPAREIFVVTEQMITEAIDLIESFIVDDEDAE